ESSLMVGRAAAVCGLVVTGGTAAEIRLLSLCGARISLPLQDYLGCIIDCGVLPLRPEEVSSLFCNIEDIYEFNSDLLEDLERSPHAAAIAECFVERVNYLHSCNNVSTSLSLCSSVAVLRDCMKNQSLVRFFQERQTTLNHSLPLETYLLKPVQRILKYHLLLQELSKHFDKSAAGYEVVEDAIITMTAVAWYINDMKRKQEHAVRLQEIESLLVNWSGPDLSGFGELVLEGSFKVHRVKKERAFFLFDKMLLIAKKRLEQFVYSTHIFCCNLLLVETLKDPLCFRVSDQTIPKQQHVVQTKNQEEKRLWVHYLKRLIVENHLASLPQKARQVLGDNFCQSPQFDQDHLKRSSASPRLDDFHGFHRGRRQSEPPELLTYTPEKSRKSLPLLLEGNLPYRRTRRQSGRQRDRQQAGSEGELCQADGLGSAGSSSTLASSVIEVEDEDDEELTPLIPPPSLSITEEILEFINQSRAREGLNNFTCPLPPVTCPSSPEQRTSRPQEKERAEMEDDSSLPSQPDGSGRKGKENGVENETTTTEVKEIPDAKSQVEEGVEADGEKQGEVEKDKEENQTRDEGEGEGIIDTPTSDLHSSISAEEERENSSSCNIPREEPPTRGSHLTKRDKKIIEKIRSYYEAAAEAGEDEAEEEDELGEGVASRRRNSFSQIPSGLVKGSVSRFDVSGHQGKTESGQSKYETTEAIDRETDGETGPYFLTHPADAENDRHADKPIGPLYEDLEEGGCEPNQAGPAEPMGNQTDPSTGLSPIEQCQKTETKTESTLTTTNHRDLDKTSGNLEGLPSQIKVGRWSRHTRIVTANRALFEGMGSDVASIGLFESSPVENSERILSKVQTLARMYSAKASTMKVPLHQKRAYGVWNQSWGFSGHSTQTQTTSQQQVQSQTQTEIPTTHQQPKSDQSAGHPVNSVREDTTPVNIMTQPAQKYNPDTPATHDKGIPEYDISTGHKDNNDTKDVQSPDAEPEYLVCTKNMDGELVLVVASTQNQPPAESPRSMVPFPGEQTQLEEGGSTTLGTFGGPKKHELTSDQMKSKETKYDLNSSAQTRMMLKGSMLIFSEEPSYHRSSRELVNPPPLSQPLHLNFDPALASSHAITETPEVQSVDCLPTFTSQRPPDLPTAMGFTSPNVLSGALSCLSPTSSSGRISTMRAPPASSPTPSTALTPSFYSSSGRPSSVRSGLPSSPTPSSSLCTSPIASSSAFTRSLAASCISQSISQSMAKKNTARQQAPPMKSVNHSPSSTPSLPSSHLQRHSTSPKLPPSQQSFSTDGYQHPRCPPSSCHSLSPTQSPPHSLSHRSPSPSMVHHQSTHFSSPSSRPSFLHSKIDSLQNANNNNNIWLADSTTKAPLANGSPNATVMQHTHDPFWSGSHNRVAQPFSASEPSSRVQSPSPSPTPSLFTRLCSPPPQHNYCSPMANKPPHPRSTRAGSANSHNPLGLTLELPTASSVSSAFVQSSSCLSPRILSPPPIGVSVNMWKNNVAAPQPRNPGFPSSSPSSPFSSSLKSSTFTSSTVPLHSSRAASPSGTCPTTSQTPSQTLRRSFSSNLSDRPPSPARSNPSGMRRSWAESSHRSFGFSGSGQGSFDQQESCPTSPRSGWSSYNSSPSCLSPRAGLQSPLSPSKLTPGKGTLSGQHFTSVPWPDVRELSTKYSGTDSLDTSATSTKEWGDPELVEGNCRSQLICAYVARPFHEQTLSSSCLVQIATKTPSKTSYATTVNLQIAGSGRITSLSTAQVSLTQTLQAGAGAGGSGQGQMVRRVSINGLSHIPSPLPQNCNRL
uniref:Pleckstrin homology domain containing, family G (with RhoGef domain) member 2 n=1 Tax=Scophthalmus maximus TaxID=52904 RepID=A0A8D2ZT69_SCOMX